MDYEFQEYPKMLFADDGFFIVADSAEEAAAIDAGYRLTVEHVEGAPVRRGRKPKGEE